jgi:glycosyltransferase domain-containing protein
MNNFTLIIPTHNRHHYLKRSMEYFKDLQADVIYCDSSSEKYEGELYPNVNYLHLPGKNFANKVLFALSGIKTNFVALCADDDFIIIDSLYKGLFFLNGNKNYKTVVGKYIAFKDKFDGDYYPLYQELPEDVDFTAEKNAEVFFKNYYQILWGMYDKDVLIKAFGIINEAKFHNDNFIELVIGTCVCHAGGIKFLKDVWGVREISTIEHWGSRHAPIVSMKIAQMHGDYSKFSQLIDSETTAGYADLAMNNYLNGRKEQVGFLRDAVSGMIPKAIKKFVRKKILTAKPASRLELSQSDNELLHSITLLLNKECSV